jgi:hypothetical protein
MSRIPEGLVAQAQALGIELEPTDTADTVRAAILQAAILRRVAHLSELAVAGDVLAVSACARGLVALTSRQPFRVVAAMDGGLRR